MQLTVFNSYLNYSTFQHVLPLTCLLFQNMEALKMSCFRAKICCLFPWRRCSRCNNAHLFLSRVHHRLCVVLGTRWTTMLQRFSSVSASSGENVVFTSWWIFILVLFNSWLSERRTGLFPALLSHHLSLFYSCYIDRTKQGGEGRLLQFNCHKASRHLWHSCSAWSAGRSQDLSLRFFSSARSESLPLSWCFTFLGGRGVYGEIKQIKHFRIAHWEWTER